MLWVVAVFCPSYLVFVTFTCECKIPILQVRDRATLYLNTLGGDGSVTETDNEVKDFLFASLDIPLVNLETSLKNYVSPIHFSCLSPVKDIILCLMCLI